MPAFYQRLLLEGNGLRSMDVPTHCVRIHLELRSRTNANLSLRNSGITLVCCSPPRASLEARSSQALGVAHWLHTQLHVLHVCHIPRPAGTSRLQATRQDNRLDVQHRNLV